MKITDVTVTLFKWENIPMKSYDHAIKAVSNSTDLGLVKIKTDQGIEGHALLGLCVHPASLEAPFITKFLKPILLGQNPLDRALLFQKMSYMRAQVSTFAVCAIDIALWDLAGKVSGLPIHALLGTFRQKIPVYASSEQHDSIEGYVEQALAVKERGLHGYKLHPSQRWREDIAACEAVRKAVGDDFNLMLDSRSGYDLGEAVKVGRAIHELGFLWYEDPLPTTDIYNYSKLLEKMDIPVMATEFPAGWLEDYAPWITNKATDMLRGDVMIKGGITSILKIAHLAEAFAMNIEIHHGGNSMNDVANLHLQMALPNTRFMEILLPQEAWRHGLIEEIQIDAQGYAHAPQNPGLGYDIDQELVERNLIAVIS